MALKFNPFEKDKPEKTPRTGRKVQRHRVFDSPEVPKDSSIPQEANVNDFIHIMDEENEFHSSYTPPLAPQPDVNEPSAFNRNEIAIDQNYKIEQRPIDKLETNRGQSGDKLETKSKLNRGQSGDKLETKKESFEKTRDKVESQPETRLETKWRQTRDKVETKPLFSQVLGVRRKLIELLYESCLRNRSTLTSAISIEFLSQSSRSSHSSVKKTLQRLEHEGFFKRVSFKNGRGGYSIYELRESIYQELLTIETRDKLETKWGQTRDKVESQPETQPETTPSSKLVSYNNLLTSEGILPEFLQADISSLANLKISQKQLNDLANQKLNISLAQMNEFIWKFQRYASDPKNVRGVQNFAGLFCKLAQQLSVGIDPLANIKTPEDEALEQQLKSAKQALTQQQALKDEHKTIQFQIWLNALSKEDRETFAPPNSIVESGSELHDKALRGYFDQNILK